VAQVTSRRHAIMPEETNYAEIDEDVSLEPEDKAKVGSNNQEWLKMTKGQVLLCAFLYFHTVDVNAVKAVRKANKAATPEEIKAAAQKALADRAAALTPPKSVDQLTPDEKIDLGTVQFKSFKAHYQQGLGFALSRIGKDGPENDAVWKKLPEAKQYFTTLLLIYPVTREGKHDVEAIKRGEWRILPWRFGPGTYDEIWNLNDGLRGNSMSIANQDIRLECKDTTYQNMKVSFVGQAAWQKNPNFKKVVLTKAMEFYGKLVPFRDMSTDQLRAKLGLTGSPVQDVSGEDFSGLLDNV
jgi:hypothetical protein